MPMIRALAFVAVLLAGVYLVGLGAAALVRPQRAKRFLSGFASSARVHFLELAARLVVGAALVLHAPQMRVPGLFVVFGWVLVVTTAGLAVVPWKWHQRFASWSVPQATRHMALFGLGSLAGGIFVLASVLLDAGR
jgi:hypothetical protein